MIKKTPLNMIKAKLKYLIIPKKIPINGGSGSERKTNALLNLVNQQPDLDKIYLFGKNIYERNIENIQ